MDALETTHQRDVDIGDVSEVEETPEEKMVKMITRISSKSRLYMPMYEGNLNPEELIDWISTMDKYFDYENVADEKKVKFAVTRLKGHVAIWWDSVQAERRNRNKGKITSCDRMVAKLKGKFLSRDYQLNIFRQMHNLKKKFISVKEYTEEFYRLSIRSGHMEVDE